MKRFHYLALTLPLVLFLIGLTAPETEAAEVPAGEVSLTLTSVAFGVGLEWGSGKLTLADGRERKFQISGLSIIDIGIKTASATGKVYRLNKMDDFVGDYSAVQAGFAFVVGASGQTMGNQNGVVMDLTAVQGGLKFSLGPKAVVPIEETFSLT